MTTRTLIVPTTHHFAAQADHAQDFGDLQRAKARIVELEAEVARLKKVNSDRLEFVEAAYIRLADYRNNWTGRDTEEGQSMLCKLRDLIAKETGWEPREVQDDYGTRAALAASKGN